MIELTVSQIEKIEEKLRDIPDKIPIVTSRAINRAAEQARTEAARGARQTYTVKYHKLIDNIKIVKAYPGRLLAEVKSKGSPLELMKFKVRANKPLPERGKYAVVSVKKGSSKIINGSFVLTIKNNEESEFTNIFIRVSKARKPIKSLFGPSIPQMIGNPSVVKSIEEKARQVLDKRIEHEINRVLGE